MGSESDSIIVDKGTALVCSVYDVVAKEHGPLFFSLNMGLLWRNIDALMKQAVNVASSDFIVVVHGTFTMEKAGKAFHGYDYPSYFSVDRSPLSFETVKLMLEV